MDTYDRKKILLAVFTLVVLLVVTTTVQANDRGPFDEIVQRILDAGGYKFTAEIEQTLIPRPVPANIGRGAERVDSALAGQVVLPDYVRMTLRFEAGAKLPPLTIEQDGADTYLIKDGERTRIENPLGAAAPAGDFASYLHAATDVRLKADPEHPQFTVYEFDIDGPLYANFVRDMMQRQLAASGQEEVRVSPSPILQRMTGHGELWVDANGLPRRQIIDTTIPEFNERYDSQSHMVTDFYFAAQENSTPSSVISTPSSVISTPLSVISTPLSVTTDHFSPDHNTAASNTQSNLSDNRLTRYTLIFAFALFLTILFTSRRRWARVILAVLLAFIFTFSPILRNVAYAKNAEARAATPTLLEALGLEDVDWNPGVDRNLGAEETAPVPAPARNTPHSTAARMRAAASGDECGSGDKVTDSDLDGTSDYVELCLGTDRYYYDSDRDGIADTLEIQGFVFTTTGSITTTFYSDPTNVDSNGDGMADYLEWPAPVGAASEWDPDGDDIPNLWDDDNDGDGLLDNIDLDPFSVTGYDDSFSLQTKLDGSSFGGYQYIEFQVQPQDETHLRYATTALDWPYDEEGSLQDLDNSTDDLTLRPVLKITTNNQPWVDLGKLYGVTTVGASNVLYEVYGYTLYGEYVLYVSLNPVSDGGKITAFQGKVAYGPGELSDITWSKMELVWVATMNHDEQNGDDIDTESVPLNEFAESSFRIAGLEITKSGNSNYAVLGTPNTPADDRDLFNIAFGLDATYLSATTPDLDEIVSRFDTDTTPITQTWGVAASDVAVLAPDEPLGDTRCGCVGHSDQVAIDISEEIPSFLNDNGYPVDDMASLILALELELGWQSLDGLDDVSGSSFTFNLDSIPVNTIRSVSLINYEYSNSAWEPMDTDEMLAVVDARYADTSSILAGLQATYPDLNATELQAVLYNFYILWTMGQVEIAYEDGVALLETSVSDAEVAVKLDLFAAVDLITYLVEVSNFYQEGGGLILDTPTGLYDYLRSESDFGSAAFSQAYLSFVLSKGVFDFVTTVTEKTLEAAAATSAAAARAAKAITVFAAILILVAAGLDLYIIWSTYLGFSSPYSYEEDYALAYAIVATVWVVVTTIIALVALVVSAVAVVFLAVFLTAFALAALIVWGISWLAGDETDVVGMMLDAITSAIVDYKAYTKVSSLDFEGLESAISSGGTVLEGATLTLSDEFTGYIERVRGDNDSQLEKSDIYAWLQADASGGSTSVVTRQGDSYCGIYDFFWFDGKICANDLEAEFTFGNAGINQTVSLLYKIQATTRYKKCWGSGISCSKKTDNMTLPNELDDGWDWADIQVDVLPDSVDGLWTWSALSNPDSDGDGLSNSEESALGTDADAWDSDGDGLSDGFEAGVQAEAGTDPTTYDTDGDGLSDGLEYQLGTTINDSDSDDDGLTDGQEVFHWDGAQWTGGGWMVSIDGEDYWVFSSPLNDDADGDYLNDASEKNAGSSPNATNDAPIVTLTAGPTLVSPTGARAVYVAAGDTVTASLNLYNIGGSPVTQTLSLCLPATLSNVNVTTSGDRTPTTQQNGDCYEWDFDSNNLLFLQEFQADLSATAGSGTLTDTLDAAVPYPVYGSSQPISVTRAFVLDNTAPSVQLTAPISNTILAGSHYVMGGYAQDGDSWVDHVQVTVPAGTYTATGTSPWAYTWELPDDGVVTAYAVAYDVLGNASAADAVTVTVDSLAPVITSSIPNSTTISSGESLSTTLILSGTVSDNYAGLTRVQMRYNEQPWRTLWSTDTYTLDTTWSGTWELPIAASAQGQHTLHLRAYDGFGNIGYHEQIVFIDLFPPTNELTNRTFTGDEPPHVSASEPITLYGVANDAGNNPLPADPAALAGSLHSISDATLWLQPDTLSDDDAGVTVAWIGDFNGDRLGDLAVGFPGMLDGAGRIVIVTGAAGDWPIPNLGELEFLADHSPSYAGVAGAGLGSTIRPAGDFNGDGFDDVLIGDPANERVFLVFGASVSSGTNRVLDGNDSSRWVEIIAQTEGESVTAGFAAAGDVNNDTLGDLFVTTTSLSGTQVYLLLGDATPLALAPQSLDLLAGAVLDAGSANVTAAGIGDVDDDYVDDFAIALDNTVYVFAGDGGWVEQGLTTLSTTQAIASYPSSDSPPDIVALGDTNGDGVDDFAYTSGSNPVVVLGDAGQTFTTQALGGFPAALSGFLVSAGDVDKDGQGDLLIGNGDGDAYLILGSDLGSVAATIEGVAAAASAPYVAGADLAGDGSSDLLLLPSATAAAALGYDTAGGTQMLQRVRKPHISSAALPRAVAGSQAPTPATRRPMASSVDVTVGTGGAVDYTSIQAAINSGADRVLIEPGVYAEVITLTANVLVAGSGADRTYLTFPGGVTDTTVLVSMDGVSNVSLMNLSLVGSGSTAGETGLSVLNNADNITLTRTIIRDMGTAVALDGANTDLDLKNNTFVGNEDGLVATNCASVDVRNTIFAYNTGTALLYNVCAAIQRHQYNLYWANGTDMTPNDPGGGELFSDPLFEDYGANDFRVADASPVIDAGAPGDPVPPGAGDFADIGHVEQTGSGFFADHGYCSTCENDGLIWGVDAFDTIQNAVDAAQEDLFTLASDTPVHFSVGVGSGIFTESVVISSSLQLLGSGANESAIQSSGRPAVTFQNTANAGVFGFTLVGGGTDPVGVQIRGGSNTISVTRNLIVNNTTGISVTERSSGWGEFNTIVSNTVGLQTGVFSTTNITATTRYNWFELENNIISHNDVGMRAYGFSVIFSNYNLMYNTLDYTNVVTGLSDIVGQDPLLTTAHAYLQTGSPALDAASSLADVPTGGGVRADIGWHELLAAPISILMGQGDDSVATESIGVGHVNYAIVPVASVDTCTTYVSTDVPKVIPTIVAIITSTLNVPATGTISDVNVRSLTGTHTYIGDLDFSLTSPEGTTVQIMAPSCDDEDNFDLDLDDEEASGPWPCPPTGGGAYQPSNPLSAFDGEERSGVWTLTVHDSFSAYGGSLEGWSLEFCTEVSDPAKTLPTSWLTATLDTPGEQLSYWRASYTPASDGLYRIYSRAGDTLGNTEANTADWYDGAFVVDSVTPVVTLTLATHPVGLDYMQLMEAQVVDYAAGSFDIEEIYFEIDGERVPGVWSLQEWGEDGVSPRTFHYFFRNRGGQATFSFQAFAVDGAGHVGSSTLKSKLLQPNDPNQDDSEAPRFLSLDVSSPSSHADLVTGTVTFQGTAGDFSGGCCLTKSYIDGYEVSLDGGASWEVIESWDYLGTPNGAFRYLWPVAGGLDATTIPVWFRATDNVGHSSITITHITLDTAPPRRFSPISFSSPAGYYFDVRTPITATWRQPLDGSGDIQSLIMTGQSGGVGEPWFPVDGLSYTGEVSEAAGWYYHIGAEDALGNLSYEVFGPWYAGSVQDRPNWGGNQFISLDGFLDIEHGEWLTPTEWLDDDDRPATPPSTQGTQSLYAMWGGEATFLGWKGGRWDTEGTLWAYYDVLTATGTTQPVTGSVSLPFDADRAVSVESTDIAYLWTYSGTTWISQTGQGNLYFYHDMVLGGTEFSFLFNDVCCLKTDGLDHHRLLAFAVDDAGEVWSAFPTANPLDGDFDYYYEWPITTDGYDLLNLPVSSQEPYLTLALVSAPPAQHTVSTGEFIQYVATLGNVEDEDAAGVKLALTGSSGLTYRTVEGATCSACLPASGGVLLDVLTITGKSMLVITVTAQLDSDLTGIENVTTTMQLTTAMPVPGTQISIAHVVDTDAPAASARFNPGQAIGRGQQRVFGFADDGFGVGVEIVEVSIDGNTWETVTGTLLWSANVDVPAAMLLAPTGDDWQLYVRATDYHSQTSATEILTFSLDSTAPLITPTVPALVGGSGFAIIQGTTQDPAPDSAEVQYVAAQLDSSTAGWANASVSDPGSGGEQNWLYGWSLPYEDGVTHTLRFRATDYAGNAITSTWESVVVDTVPPALNVTQHRAYVLQGGSNPALRGNVTDGVAVISVTLLVYPESGAATQEGATLVDDAWSYVLNMPLGAYTLLAQAQDSAGNTRLIGPYSVQVVEAIPLCFAEINGVGAADYYSTDANAVQTAIDAAAPEDTIKVAGTCVGVQVRNSLTQTLYISKNLTIQGGYTITNWSTSSPTLYPTILDAQNAGRVVYIPNGYTVSLVNLTLAGGDGYQGGGANSYGGGLYANGSVDLILTSSTITNNTAERGGGLFNNGNLTLAASTLISNTASTWGGGLLNSNVGTMIISDSTIHNNRGSTGGGIFNNHTLTLTNSTVSGNTANSGVGGGIRNAGGDTLVVIYSTIVSNTASTNSDGLYIDGTLTLTSSIIANNTGGYDCVLGSGSIVDGGYNLIEDSGNACGLTDGSNGNVVGSDPLLGPLSDNGADTLTHLPLPFSPAVDRIPNGANGCGVAVVDDQRGYPRPVDGACDVGAVELEVNYAPVATGDTYPVTEDVLLDVAASGVLSNDLDGDWDVITAVLGTDVTTGVLTLNSDGSLSYTPTLDFCGSDSFTYHASDGVLDSNVVTVTLDVTCTDDAPVAIDDAYTTDYETPLVVDAANGVLDNDSDVDGDPLTATLEGGPSNGTLDLDLDGSFVYTPTAGYSGLDSYTYIASDGALTDTATVVIGVGVIPTFTLTIAVDGSGSGTVEPEVGPHVYELNTVVTLTATADLDSEFVGWSGDLVSTTNPADITMTRDMTVTATFDRVGYYIYLPITLRNK